MSIKSLLQLILFLLIFLFIGGIYFLYFYSGPLKNQTNLIENIEKIETAEYNKDNGGDQEILDDLTQKNKITEEKLDLNDANIISQDILKKENGNKNDYKNKVNKYDNNNLKNLTKEIEYITSNNNGDTFKIFAKYGTSSLKNTNILILEIVNGVISSNDKSNIYISSDFAEYNYENQNSKFYKNVEIKYDNKKITCDNLDLKISDNIAVAYNNVMIENDKSTMKAQIIEMDISTKDISINSQKKVKISIN